MCTRGLPDLFTLSSQACGSQASGVYIRQTIHAHGITINYNILPDVVVNITRDVVTNDTVGLKLDTSPVAI